MSSTFLPPKVLQRLAKEVYDIQKNKLDGVEILTQDQSGQDLLSNLTEIYATIDGPQGTPFQGGKFTIKLVFCEEFPNKPPKGYFVTKIFHPNVSREGDICVNTLKRDWKSTLGLRHILLVIRCLMIEPNPDSALNAEAGRLIQDNYEAFSSKAKMFTEIYAKPNQVVNVSSVNSSPMDVDNIVNEKVNVEKTMSECSKENVVNENASNVAPQKKIILVKKTTTTATSTGMTQQAKKPVNLKRL
ncbi:hypothetical protein ABK040_014720 [Willaertia magna]